MQIKILIFIILFFQINETLAQQPYFELSKKCGLQHSSYKSKFYNGELYTLQFFTSGQQVFLNLTIRNTAGNLWYNHDFFLGNQGTSNDLALFAYYIDFEIENGNVYVAGNTTNSMTLNASINQNLLNNSNSFLLLISEQTIQSNGVNLDYFSFLTGNLLSQSNQVQFKELVVENGNAYLLYTALLDDLYTSNSSLWSGSNDIYLIKVSDVCIATNVSFQNDINSFASYFGTINSDGASKLNVKDGNVYLIGEENGSGHSIHKIKKTSIDNELSLTQMGEVSSFNLPDSYYYDIPTYLITGNEIYITGGISDSSSYTDDAYLIKLTQAEFDAGTVTPSYFSLVFDEESYACFGTQLVIYEDSIYIAGYITAEYEYSKSFVKQIPLSLIQNNQDILQSNLPKVIDIGNFNYDVYHSIHSIYVNEFGIHILGNTFAYEWPFSNFNYTSTNQTTINNSGFYLNFCLSTEYSYGTSMALNTDIRQFYENKLYTCAYQGSEDEIHSILTVPNQSTSIGLQNQFYSIITYDTLQSTNFSDTLSPGSQTICAFSTADAIIGVNNSLELASVPPPIIEVGVNQKAQTVSIDYFWEQAGSPSGPWSRIPNAILKDYLPVVSNVNAYYRRASYLVKCGDTIIVSVSDVSSVLINEFTAPVVNAGGIFHTCPNDDVIIGGNPSASGGLAPYQFSWDNNLDGIANPGCSVANNSIVTLTVFDSNGCRKIDQATIYVHQANAGLNKSVCDGDSVIIGSLPIQGLSTVTYTWTPDQGINCNTCAQSTAAPLVETTYTLNLSLINSDGDVCQTTDDVLVRVQAPPVNPDFAGPDVTTCLGTPVSIGLAPEPGFVYKWYSYRYLSNYQVAQTTFDYNGSIHQLYTNPEIKFLQASKNGCDFVDDVAISVIQANAGLGACGPALIGTPDYTPNLSETYTWTKISGPGYFTGPTDQPQTTVSSSIGSPTIFELSVSLNGVTCTDQITIADCGSGGGFNCGIYSQSTIGCPSTILTDDPILLIAGITSSTANLEYSWTPATGLSNYDTRIVTLETDASQAYTVVVTDPNDPTFFCTHTIVVNNPNWNVPIVEALDTSLCRYDLVQLSTSNDPNYLYTWTKNGIFISSDGNPVVSVNSLGTNIYNLLVIDTISNCKFQTSATILARSIQYTPSPDWNVCSNILVALGNAANQNLSNSWEPSNSPWQNGTSNLDATPQVLLSNTTTFVNTLTDTLGCTATDTMIVNIAQLPVVPAFQNAYFCYGQDSLQIGRPAQNGLTYSWFPSTGLSCIDCAQPMVAYQATATTYFVTIGMEGDCVAPIQRSVLVSPANQPLSIPDISYCPSDGDEVNLANNIDASNYVEFFWYPDNLVSDPYILNPIAEVTGTKTFFLTLIDNHSCLYKDTVVVTPIVAAANAGYSQSICLSAGSVVLGDPSNSGNLTWSPTTDLSGTNTPTTVFTPSSAGTFYFQLTNSDGSCSATDLVTVNVISIAPLNLTNKFICANSCSEIGVTGNPAYSYQWSPSENLDNPTISNPTACVSQSTNFTVTITSPQGCELTQNVLVSLSDSISPTISLPPVTVCQDSIFASINAEVSPANGNYIVSWTPTIGLENPSSLQTELLTVYAQQNNYTLTLTNLDNNCSATKDLDITIIDCSLPTVCDIPFSIVSTADSICSGANFSLAFSSNSSNVDYEWEADGILATGFSSGNGPLINQNLSASGNTPGQVTYVITPSIGTCYGESQSFTVVVVNNPIASINGNLSYCQNDSAYLYTSDLFSSYLWSNGSTDTVGYFTNSDNPINLTATNYFGCTGNSGLVNLSELSSSTYLDTVFICQGDSVLIFNQYEQVEGIYTNVFQGVVCDSIVQTQLIVNPLPVANFELSSSSELWQNSTVVFENYSSNATNFVWIFNNDDGNVSTNTLNSQSTQFSQIGEYTVALVAINEETGCVDTSFHLITIQSYEGIKNCNPNIFTPNNDNINDYFYLDFCGALVTGIKIKIFNRWGNLMKEIGIPYNSEDPESYWDGRTSDGKEAVEGTYFYVYEVNTKSGTKISGHGYLTLIRK